MRARIVVADDNPDIREFISFVLEGAGYEVHAVNEGAQALALLDSAPADLVITDLFMPGQHGFETISRCKAQHPQTRILVVSSGNVPGMPHDFLAKVELLGATALRKPFAAETLLDTVCEVLQRG